MKRKVIIGLIAGMMVLSPITAFAEPETETEETPIIIEHDGLKLEYLDYEVSKDYEGNDVVILYFDFTNDSGKTKAVTEAFDFTVFQNDIEQKGYPILEDDNEFVSNKSADVRSGAKTVKIADVQPLTDMSDIIVNVRPYGGDEVEFTLSLE